MTLKHLLIVVFIFFSHVISAQLTDNFLDSNFSANPSWNGDVNAYEIDAAYQLHLNAISQTDTSYLSTPSKAIKNATWEFLVKFNFNPSSSNYAKIYLVV